MGQRKEEFVSWIFYFTSYIFFALWAYIIYLRYFNYMKDSTSINVLQQGKLSKLFSYWEPQTCVPRKVEELTFEYVPVTLKNLFLSCCKVISQIIIFLMDHSAHFWLLFRRHSCIFINNVSISIIIKFVLARSCVWQAVQSPLSRLDYDDLHPQCGVKT